MIQEKTIIFHGSKEVIKTPEILVSNHSKDFGYGFYCTELFAQASRWAKRGLPGHSKPKGSPIVNVYFYTPNENLKVLSFDKMNDEWLDFIALCRNAHGYVPHDYDIVEGPMADDEVWNYVEDFLAGRISRTAFWELCKFKYPTHQITFHTEKALKCLEFKEAINV